MVHKDFAVFAVLNRFDYTILEILHSESTICYCFLLYQITFIFRHINDFFSYYDKIFLIAESTP